MKQFALFAFISFSLLSCTDPAKSSSENKNVAEIKPDFDWLRGKWIRLNDKDGKQTFETWEKKANSEYNGFAYTMKDRDTIWQETIQLMRTNDQWSFNVTGKGEPKPTKFKVTTQKERKFICENQANEFPKVIEYASAGDTLHAKISGGAMEVLFDFKKVD